MQLCFVTGNQNKLREAKDILKGFSITNEAVDIVEIQGSKEEIAKDKAEKAFAKLKKPVFVDDTCLELEALDGLPGPYIVHFIDKIGAEGIFRLLKDFENKNAKAVCMIGYCDGNTTKVFEGMTKGTIVSSRGSNNFGFDPVFLPEGNEKTYAEMTPEKKNSISHRAKALNLLRTYLEGAKE